MFSDDQIRLKMNAIIHPRVRVLFDEFIQQQSSTIVFNEAAILIETGAYKLFDQLVLVTAPDELKIKRVMEREQCSRESVIDRMEKQWTDAAKKDVADFVLVNDEESLLIPQIETLIQALKSIH
jgi:dephospho-CoA kinase